MRGGCRGLSSSQYLMSPNNSAAPELLTKFAACSNIVSSSTTKSE